MKRIQKGEGARKSIHYTASLIPILYYFVFDRSITLSVLAVCSLTFILAEIMRMRYPGLYRIYLKIFGFMIRSHERQAKFTGATFVFLGSFLTVLLFSKEVAVTVLLFLTIGDPTACLIGLARGKHKLIGDKTLEGSLAFILASLLATCWIPMVPFPIKIAGAITAALVELIPWRIDDNLTIPLLSGTLMMFLMA
ncbi:MAG: hypothetical protein R6U38_16750 [Desulfatiglandaceae bacterium]